MSQEVGFVTMVRTPLEKRHAALFIASLRAFGGSLARSPVRVYEFQTVGQPCADLASDGVEVLPLEVPPPISHYLFADKVSACASAEQSWQRQVSSMAWVNPESLVVQPPELFKLTPPFHAAFRPVHIRNIGSLTRGPLDDYWRRIYKRTGLSGADHPALESFVDQQLIRPYYNTHAFALDPSLGICRDWLALFTDLVQDKTFQEHACADDPHRIFLHQAALSALLTRFLDVCTIRLLPPSYSYPWHLHARVSADQKALLLDDLVLPVYEDYLPLDAADNNFLPASEFFHTWLDDHTV